MHESSKAEKWIIKKYITDPKLSTSLTLLRAAMESIWVNDAPKIVHNYTDHGEEHCKRVAGFVEKLLRVNPSVKFSQQEIYLLLAGVYLHDIGMQCDILKYPKVKEKAEKLGAKLDVEFTAKASSDYSQKEQDEIRKNHNYLSAAWIDYLYDESDSSLSNAIKSVPDYLIDDLIDICKFHSQLSINDCPDFFNHNPNNRKKLISAILRFADELDISSTRINLETVIIFNLNPDNSVYWWLHNYTEVIFINSNTISLTVRLHPEDFELYNTFIGKDYISNFRSKNQPVLDVLVGQKIPLMISNNSGVVSDRRAKKFPSKITAILDKKIQNTVVHEAPSKTNIPKSLINKSTDMEYIAPQKANVLLVTTTKVESKAVLNIFQNTTSQASQTMLIGERIYHDIGNINGKKVYMVQSEMGSGGLGASLHTVQKGIIDLSPTEVIMVGIAFGIDPKKQYIGDILVSKQLMLYELQRVGKENGNPKIILRGDKAHASSLLLSYFRNADLCWDESKCKVNFGLILSGEKLVDNIDFRQQLCDLNPEAIGGEMEGSGLFVACHESKVDWILVKSICDWADGNKSENKESWQKLAAENAASFVLHMLQLVPFTGKSQEYKNVNDTSSNFKTTATNSASSKGVNKSVGSIRVSKSDDFESLIDAENINKQFEIAKTMVKKVLIGFLNDWKSYSKSNEIWSNEDAEYIEFVAINNRLDYHLFQFTFVSNEVDAVDVLPDVVSNKLIELAAKMRVIKSRSNIVSSDAWSREYLSSIPNQLDELLADIKEMYKNLDKIQSST